MIAALVLAAFLPPAGWRIDALPAIKAGIPKIPISVPSDWKTKERSPALSGFRKNTPPESEE